MVVLLGHPSIINAAEFAVGVPYLGWFHTCPRRHGWIEDPTRGWATKLTPLIGWHRLLTVFGEEEKDIAVRDCEVVYDVSGFVLVAACYVSYRKSGT